MKTSQTIRTIVTIFSILFAAQAFAQGVPTVSIPSANLVTTSTDKEYSFSDVGQKIGIVRNGTATVTFTGTINFRNNDTLYIGDGVNFNPEFINGFSSGCMIINGGTANLDDCEFTGGQIDNYGVMKASYFGVTNFTLNNYADFNTVNGCSLNASQINNYSTLTTGYLGMTGDPSSIINSAAGNMTIASSGRIAVSGSLLRNEGRLQVQSFFTSEAGTTVINKGRLQTTNDFNIGGIMANKGMLITGGKMNIAATATIFNSCRMVTGQLSNATAKMGNYGILWVLENVYGAFTNNGTIKNAGYIRTTQFFNAASGIITNSLNNTYTNGNDQDGYIRIEGGADVAESVNKGAVTGGKICDAANQSYMLDTVGNMTAVMTLVNAYDTTTYQSAPMLPCNCAGINQTTDTVVGVQLSGEQLTSYNQVNWVFASAPNLASVELQAATNEQDYTALQVTNMAGTQNTNYNYQHTQLASPVYYYRLKLTATDSTVTFSNVVRLGMQWAAGVEEHHAAATSATVSYFPNPFSDNINISMTAEQNEAVRVMVYDLSGRTVAAVDYNAHTGENSFNVSGLQSLLPGIYMLQLHTAESNQNFQYKIVKQ